MVHMRRVCLFIITVLLVLFDADQLYGLKSRIKLEEKITFITIDQKYYFCLFAKVYFVLFGVEAQAVLCL